MQDPNLDVLQSVAALELDSAQLAEDERRLLRFVRKVTEHAYKVVDEDVEELRNFGWTDAQIAECVYITALFAFFNRVADAFGLEDPGYFFNPPARGGDPLPSAEQPAANERADSTG